MFSSTKSNYLKFNLFNNSISIKKEIPKLEEFLEKRDYIGALTLMEFERNCEKANVETDLWIAFLAFHLNDYKKAIEEYNKLLTNSTKSPEIAMYLACCYFYLGMNEQALKLVKEGSVCKLQKKLLFYLTDKSNSNKKSINNLGDSIDDQLSIAFLYFSQNNYTQANEIYQRILFDNRDYIALNYFLALCYYQSDNLGAAMEYLNIYLQNYPDSASAMNLKFSICFKLYGKIKEPEIKELQDLYSSLTHFKNLINHNLVVFRNGEGALQILPQLLDLIPEARQNLIIYHLRNDEIHEAYELAKDTQPMTLQDYVLLGAVNALIGQELDSTEHLKLAQRHFQMVGGSETECNTILGCQCRFSCLFLLGQFNDAALYLEPIKNNFYDEAFIFNCAQVKATLGLYKEAKDLFLQIQMDKIRSDYVYLSWLARCYIRNKEANLAWDLYLKMETCRESFSLLQLIANDCYLTGQFYYAAKAFNILHHLDSNAEYGNGKQSACIGVFQLYFDEQESKEHLHEIIQILQKSNNPDSDYWLKLMKKWIVKK